MFNKTKPQAQPKEAPKAAPAQALPPLTEAPASLAKKPSASMAQGSRGFSSIGSGLIVEGNIYGTADLVIDGTIRGDVKVGHLTIGESGNIEGKVEAESIEVRGRIVGSILGRNIRLQATAYVEGDITHDQLSIETGAFFQGRCQQARKPESINVAPMGAANPFATSDAPKPAASTPLSAYDLNALSDLK